MTAEPLCEVVSPTRCGYCNRPLVYRASGRWECPRCAPRLAALPDDYESALAAYGRFRRAARKDFARATGRTNQTEVEA